MSQRCLSLARRAHMWQVCVWTTLGYGLTCTGCTALHMQLISGVVAKQLRSVARMPRHITHATNEEVHERVGIPMPADLLLKASQNLSDRLQQAKVSLPMTDVMQWPSIHRQAVWASRLLEDARHYATKLVRVLDGDGVPCPQCGLYFADESGMRKHLSRKHPEVVQETNAEIKRELHCIDGMPTCRGCGKKFHHMQTLLRHIRHKRCAGGFVPESLTAADPLPLSQRHALLQKWSAGGANALLDSLQSDASLRKEMLEHCCLCRQWIADRRHVKLHIRQSHGEQYQALHDKVIADCQQLAGAITSFCPFCDITSLTNRQRHAIGCTVLYQAAFCCRIHGKSEGTGNRLTLRELLPAVNKSQATNKTSRAIDAEESQPRKWPRPKGKGHGQKGQQGQNKPASLRSWQDEGDQSENQAIQMLIQLCLRQEDSINVMRMDRAYLMLFKTKGQETLLPTFKDIADKWKERREAGTTEAPLRVVIFKCMALELQNRAKQLMETKMEELVKQGWVIKKENTEFCWLPMMYHQEKKHDVPVPDVGPLPHSDAISALEKIIQNMDGQTIQCYHATRPLADSYTGDMLAFMLEVSIRGPEPLRVHQALAKLANSTIWYLIGARMRPDTPKRSPLAVKLQESVLTLALHNYGNTCYQNSFALSWGWSWAACAMLQGWPVLNNDRLGTCAPILLALYSGAYGRLSNILAWAQVLQTWRRPQDQHDVGEFASHALSRLRPSVMHGHWVSRVEDPILRNTDTGLLRMPLAISIPTGAASLQDCVDAWQSQPHVHALLDVPPLILLQLGRFRHRSHRHVTKLRVEIAIEGTISIPVFDEGLVTRSAQYRVVGGVLHIGGTPSSGHYRSFLSSFAGVPEHSALDQAYITDDGQMAHPLSAEDRCLISANAYLVWCVKC